MGIKRKIEIDISVTPKDLVREFLELSGDEKAMFFNFMSDLVTSEWHESLSTQLQVVTDSGMLKPGGRKVMADIGAYSEKK